MYYNFGPIHKTLRITPAIQTGVGPYMESSGSNPILKFAKIALIALVTSSALADSQPPVPTSSKESHPAAKGQCGTENQPLIVKVENCPRAESKPAQTENQNSNKPAFDWPKEALAKFITTEEALARFTRYLVLVGAATALVLLIQSWLIKQQIEAPRRPRFFVREVLHFPITAGSDTLKIQFSIGNAGDAKGTIVESYFDAQYSTLELWRPQRPPKDVNVMGPITISPGGQKYWDFDYKTEVTILTNLASAEVAMEQRAKQFGAFMPATQTLTPSPVVHLHGFIVYIDENGVKHRTAILRYLNLMTLRFDRREEPDYEYAD
jgi:hypothetical protein